MPVNKNALMRYRLIDAALRNRYKPFPNKYDLIKACENLGRISRRTIEKDLYDMMFDEELRYEAPIKYSRKEKGYFYDDPNYSINNFPLKEQDLNTLEFACSLLKQFGNLDPAMQLLESVEKMETYMKTVGQSKNWQNLIQAEKSLSEAGMDFLGPLLEAIRSTTRCLLVYQRFQSDIAKSYFFHPYVLKQYRHRWYVIGYREDRNEVGIFSLDRIRELELLNESFELSKNFSAEDYFKYSFGITVQPQEKPHKIRLKFNKTEAPFIKSQPLHQSQEIVEENENFMILEIYCWIGFELTNAILGYGSRVEVISPPELRNQIRSEYQNALALFTN